MKIMPPRRDPSIEDFASTATTQIQDLTMALQELLHLQQRRDPTPMQLDKHFQLPKFVGQINGENVNFWLRSLFNYFCTCPKMTEEMKL